MQLTLIRSLILSLSLFVSAGTRAAIVVINPSDDGAIYMLSSGPSVNNGGYVTVAGYIQGIVKFPTVQIAGVVTQAVLSVNPYALPLFDLTVDVYGIASSTGTVSESDGDAGTFLGTLNLPSNLGYGQDAYFDVTAFIAGNRSSFVGFNLRTDSGTDVLSSMEYNYGRASQLTVTVDASHGTHHGHPSQLAVTEVPEPSATLMLFGGTAMFGLIRRRSRAGTRN